MIASSIRSVAALPVALSAIAFSLPGLAQSPISNPQDLPRLYAEAMAAGDVGAIVSLYAPNAILMTPEGPVASGTEQIRALMTRNFPAGPSSA